MKVDINYKFKNLNGKVIKEKVIVQDEDGNPIRDAENFPIFKWGKPITLRKVCEQALLDVYVDPKTGRPEQISRDDKRIQYFLAEKIHQSNGIVDLQAEEITLLKDLIDKKFPSPSTVTQACEILDPTGEDKKKKK